MLAAMLIERFEFTKQRWPHWSPLPPEPLLITTLSMPPVPGDQFNRQLSIGPIGRSCHQSPHHPEHVVELGLSSKCRTTRPHPRHPLLALPAGSPWGHCRAAGRLQQLKPAGGLAGLQGGGGGWGG